MTDFTQDSQSPETQSTGRLAVDIRRNLEQVEAQIAAACRAANRSRESVELMAVSKTHPAAALAEALELGLHLFGENKVQEFAAKSAELSAPVAEDAGPTIRSQMRTHLIGHLQSNKAAKAVEVFDGIDTLDSLKLAERLDSAVEASPLWSPLKSSGRRLPVLLEIKLSEEETKSGLAPDSRELAELLERLPSLTHLEAQGLMTIAPFNVPEAETRSCFRALRQLQEKLASQHPRLHLPVLSMGMSGDFALAIAECSTRIRVGTAIFGAREYPQ
jgi:pyridoxal phosphate enzyme (YggS family)